MHFSDFMDIYNVEWVLSPANSYGLMDGVMIWPLQITFGGNCGGLYPKIIAKMMKEAYEQVNNPPKQLDWQYHIELN